jgi:L-fuconolactonase
MNQDSGKKTKSLAIIDSHVHLWDVSKIPVSWVTTEPTEFLMKDFEEQTKSFGIEGIVLVEPCSDSSRTNNYQYGLEEARWFSELAKDSQIPIKAIVAFAPLDSGDEGQSWYDQLKLLPLVKGVRQVIQGESDDYCLTSKFKEGVHCASRNGYSVDICIKGDKQLENIIQLISTSSPDITFILDHIAKPSIDQNILDPWRDLISQLATFPNVYCKISGIITEALPNWSNKDIIPYIDHIVNAFGKDRILYGSDCPVSFNRSDSYDVWINSLFQIIRHELKPQFTFEDKTKLFSQNAKKVYRF